MLNLRSSAMHWEAVDICVLSGETQLNIPNNLLALLVKDDVKIILENK